MSSSTPAVRREAVPLSTFGRASIGRWVVTVLRQDDGALSAAKADVAHLNSDSSLRSGSSGRAPWRGRALRS